MPWSVVEVNRSFGRTYCLHLQGHHVPLKRHFSWTTRRRIPVAFISSLVLYDSLGFMSYDLIQSCSAVLNAFCNVREWKMCFVFYGLFSVYQNYVSDVSVHVTPYCVSLVRVANISYLAISIGSFQVLEFIWNNELGFHSSSVVERTVDVISHLAVCVLK
jgi:hypothetical protein